MGEVILRADSISKSFGITKAVRNVSMSFQKGEIRGLIGENGSGKSTFVSMLCGIYTIDNGKFYLNGEELKIKNQVEANKKGISIIVQEMGTLSGLTVAENIFLGHEDRFVKYGIKNASTMIREAKRLLKQYGFNEINPNTMIDYYSFEQRKLIEIVKATYFSPRIFVIDETTTALSKQGREELYKIMNQIKSEGNTIIFISHDLLEVIKYSDNISVFRDGKLIDTVPSQNVEEDELKKLMVGRKLTSDYYRRDYGKLVSKGVVLSVRDVSVPGQIENISFDLHEGEILGIGGISGSGMHELGKAICGASFYRTGKVILGDGTEVNSISTAIENGIAYASRDRDIESLVINDSIRDNICLPSLSDLMIRNIISDRALNKFARDNADLINIKMESINQFVSNLSGGNRQKVVLARWLGKNSDIIVLDSPTRGIDVKVKADIYSILSDLKKKNKSIVIISEEILELIGMSDRILILKKGRISGEFFRKKDLSEEDLIAKMV